MTYGTYFLHIYVVLVIYSRGEFRNSEIRNVGSPVLSSDVMCLSIMRSDSAQ